jgi:response regulator of citrate/malate metabolism
MSTSEQLQSQPQPTISKSPPLHKIFVVEDDPYFTKLTETYLHQIASERKVHFGVKTFLDGASMLKCMEEAPTLIILDYYLTAHDEGKLRNGFLVLEKIKEYDANIDVLIISQVTMWEDFTREFKSAGAYDFICKDDFFFDNLRKVLIDLFNRTA